ncbi:hypothetical protein GCM10023191_006390 [Actinoallomurus oryzae]|uniref:Uncharacterized protein n=1 Tax=Actinoallomurus oryzae TaxID=502180 RepID=A0ABP8PBS8_9ACTN
MDNGGGQVRSRADLRFGEAFGDPPAAETGAVVHLGIPSVGAERAGGADAVEAAFPSVQPGIGTEA